MKYPGEGPGIEPSIAFERAECLGLRFIERSTPALYPSLVRKEQSLDQHDVQPLV